MSDKIAAKAFRSRQSGNDGRPQSAPLCGRTEGGIDLCQRKPRVDQLAKRETIPVGAHELQCCQQVPWRVVVDALDGHTSSDDLASIEGHRRARNNEAGRDEAAPGTQQLEGLRQGGRSAGRS